MLRARIYFTASIAVVLYIKQWYRIAKLYIRVHVSTIPNLIQAHTYLLLFPPEQFRRTAEWNTIPIVFVSSIVFVFGIALYKP